MDSEKRLYDDFSLRCGPHMHNMEDKQYMNHMFFDVSDVNVGVITGTWDRVDFLAFPDTVSLL